MNISEALKSLCPNAEFSVLNDSYENIEWFSRDIAKPSKEEVDAEVFRLKNDYEAKKYQRDRAEAYPSIADQLDTLYHGGYDAWKATIEAVKNQYPKP